ncbi:MAG: PLP-dependent aspartate aminotransferase family protein [Lentisphaeria bacterium]|jgi:cystathionine beta-lyase/cystathionine gamma-synthase
MPNHHPHTLLAQAGARWDDKTGAISLPIHHSATFRHPALGQSTGFDYSRTANPTRQVLEETVARLEGATRALAFASGLAAIDAVLRLFQPGDRLLATEDLYGGTFRLFEKLFRPYGIETIYADTSDRAAVQATLRRCGIRGVFLETPSNPLLKIADIPAIAAAAHDAGALTIVDNTFLTACRQRPLELGADIVLYSASKYLGGHNDVIAGIAATHRPELAERLAFFQNAAGAILGPQESWLLLRGLKTLPLRLAKQEANAGRLAAWLADHPHVRRVHYPGLPGHPGRDTLARQATGAGAMIAFEVADPGRVPHILANVQTFLFAESLGGVESLITFPAAQTHADLDPATRDRLGINDRLLRLSIGIEECQDLQDDLEAVL